VTIQAPVQRWSSKLRRPSTQYRCAWGALSHTSQRSRGAICNNDNQVKAEQFGTKPPPVSLRPPRPLSLVTQPWSSTLRNQRLKIPSLWQSLYINQYCLFTTGRLWNSNERAYFISQPRGTDYVTPREQSVRSKSFCATSWRWQARYSDMPPKPLMLCVTVVLAKQTTISVFIYESNKFCWEAWHYRVNRRTRNKGRAWEQWVSNI
jgi:hypothetical protein